MWDKAGTKSYKRRKKKHTNVFVSVEVGQDSSLPVQYEVLCKDELARAVDRPPDKPDHQHLQP